MTECYQRSFEFPACKSRKVQVDFNGGEVTSDAGVLLLRQADRKLRLTKELHQLLNDPRRQASCDHSQIEMLCQRIYGLALGYEDLNDHETLRKNIALQTVAQTWDRQRRVSAKAEHTEQGSNPRYIVTNLTGDPLALYDEVYCARGEMEDRIKEQQLDLFADRTSCTKWWANQFRLTRMRTT